ncbi:MAG: EAL domain-containing protein [Solirubrobacterales bacterium]
MSVGALKQPNDLYVTLAFAAADMLFELDGHGRIAFAVGAAMALLGRPARLLPESAFSEMVVPGDQARLDRALAAMRRGERVRGVLLEMQRPDGGSVHVTLSGYAHPNRADALMVVLAHATGHLAEDLSRAPQTGLLDKEAFEARARTLLQDPSHAEDSYRLTLLELPEMAELRRSVGAERAEQFMTRLGERLSALSVGGDAAGQLSDSKYGVIHSGTVDPAVISAAVAEAAAGVPAAAVPQARSTSLVLDVADMSPADAARALTYALNSFTDEDAALGPEALATKIQPKLSATVREMKAVREVIETGAFEVVYQPIVDLWTNVVHHFECLVRFGDGTQSPYDTVTFAEDTGLVGELDMAVLERVMAVMRTKAGSSPALRYAVNLSGYSLSEPRICARLREMLGNAGDLAGRLLLEVTESSSIGDLAAVNAVIQEFRRQRFEVCLDDFGAGHAAFHYLRGLKVDHVKIDGSYVKDCMQNNENIAFIKAMVQLCTELGVATTAEYVEDTATANLLKVLKVRYGQGYLFGKPHRPDPGRYAEDLRAWASPSLEWRKGLLCVR